MSGFAASFMNYQQSLKYLNHFINYERIVLNKGNRDLNLKRMQYLMRLFRLEKPSFFPVLIAGTKGKGSTGYFLESILSEAGCKTGFYLSPHLQTPLERIRLAGSMLPEKKWAEGLQQIKNKLDRQKWPQHLGELTYFEILTFLAILIFEQKKVDIGIFEVGLGGRLDATNVLNAPVSIITTIGFDHEAFLGNTLAAIAGEKAAIIRPKAHVIVSPQKPEAGAVIKRTAAKLKAHLNEAAPVKKSPGLKGDFQKINAGSASQAADILKRYYGFDIGAGAIRRGLARKDWPGRYECVHQYGHGWILDAAHNPAAIAAISSEIRKLGRFRRKIALFAVARDKNAPEMLKSLSRHFKEIIFIETGDPRGSSVADLVEQAAPCFEKIYPLFNLNQAMEFIKMTADKRTLVLVTGSFHIVGAARELLLGHKK